MSIIFSNSFNLGSWYSEFIASKHLSDTLKEKRVSHYIIPEDAIEYDGPHGHIRGCFDFIIAFIYKGKVKTCGVQVVRAMTHPSHYNNNNSYNINYNKLYEKIDQIKNGKRLFTGINKANIFKYGDFINISNIDKINYTMVIVIKQSNSSINNKSYPNVDPIILNRMKQDMNKYTEILNKINKIHKNGILVHVKNITVGNYDCCFKSHKKQQS